MQRRGRMSDGYGRSATSPISADQGVRLIVWTCLEEGVTDRRQIAYVLATAQHESLGFSRLEEDYGRKQAVTLGYHGGEDYFGRGYVHLTHDINYRSLGRAVGLGERLVDEPSLAERPPDRGAGSRGRDARWTVRPGPRTRTLCRRRAGRLPGRAQDRQRARSRGRHRPARRRLGSPCRRSRRQ